MNKKEFLEKIQEVNLWHFEQIDRYSNGEIKANTLISYKTRHKQRRNKIINEYKKQSSKVEIKGKIRGLFDKW